jgi:membrane protease YdiL (CAAX protease family)
MKPSMFSDDNPLAQLALTILTCLSCLFLCVSIGSFFSFLIYHVHPADLQLELQNPANISLQKFFQSVQGIGLFIIPAIILGYAFSGNGFGYLKLDKAPAKLNILLVLIITFSSIPVINLIAGFNSMIRLPEFMPGAQQYIDQTSKTYQTVTESYMKANSISGIAVNLLIIAIIPAFGEEFLFRGVFQRIFTNWTRNPHWGILIASFIFSAIHMDFYGFFPRWILGIMFGYFLLWSGSIWLPVLAHFLNNAIAVIVFYLISNGKLNEKMADIGSTYDILPFTIICSVFMGAGIYYLYKKRTTY